MTTYAVMYLEINLISVILVLIIKYKTAGLSKMVAQRNFANAIHAQIVFFLSDTLTVMSENGIIPYSPALIMAAKTVYFLFTMLMCFCWFVYFEHIQASLFVRNRRNVMLSSVLVWVMGALLTVNLFNGMLFYTDEQGEYHRGRLFIILYLLSYIYVFITCLRALIGIFDKRKIAQRKTLIYLALFPVAPAGAGIVQFIRPDLPVACAALSIATLIMYLNWTDEMIAVDPLTKLSNRKHLSYYYDQWQQEPAEPLTLMMVDANKFKGINDTYGHVQGDAALVRIADALRLACRETGKRSNIARYGGDEFVVLIRSKDEAAISNLKSRISEHLARLNTEADAPYELTVSIGWATAERDTPLKDLIVQADEQLYAEKSLISRR